MAAGRVTIRCVTPQAVALRACDSSANNPLQCAYCPSGRYTQYQGRTTYNQVRAPHAVACESATDADNLHPSSARCVQQAATRSTLGAQAPLNARHARPVATASTPDAQATPSALCVQAERLHLRVQLLARNVEPGRDCATRARAPRPSTSAATLFTQRPLPAPPASTAPVANTTRPARGRFATAAQRDHTPR